ncbi:M14 family zinc carboxypeptidase [Pleionea sp. CnH1-48]|uniref:M14 family zinc carboxypeptidase n=1 Tax=Pleionea sp. CnH1-48 TaxID=2954494 RepID=UPI0020968FC0|nr:M14 family zinc carboxypeptidase [Pleionea sp. CnH1-48]MCO7225343.1 hypothetical protein [Pleionea sp. CnH1-48]
MIRILSLFFLTAFQAGVLATLVDYTENDSSNGNLALGYPVPVPVASTLPVDGFRTFNSLHARHQDMALVSQHINGQIIGQTFLGRDIWAYVLSDGDNVTHEGMIIEGAMLQNGGIHAREWQSPEVVTGIIERFFDNEQDQGFYQYLLENTSVIIIPVLNIDGFTQTQRSPTRVMLSTFSGDSSTTPRDGRMRRKNMRGVDTDIATEADNLFGVDLNRNNNPYWASSNRSSSDNQSLVHHGSGPASEPETQALQAAANLGPANRLRFYIDTHSFTKIYFTPMTSNTRRNAITENLATAMRAVNNNTYDYGPSQPGGGIGSTDEYFANTYQIPSYTLETEPSSNGGADYGGTGVTHDGFILPDSQITRVRSELANASILGYFRQAGPPAVTGIRIERADNSEVVFAGQWQATSAMARQWNESTNLGLVNDVEYRLKITFNKPMRWRNAQDQTIQYPGLSVTLQPSVALEGKDASGNGFSLPLSTTSGTWLNVPGGGMEHFSRYKSDAFLFNFTVPASTNMNGAQLLQFAIQTQDLSGASLDASPATVVDWSNGAWSRYESTNGSQADSGGLDRTVRLVNDGSAGFIDPTATGGGGNGNSGGGSGGGALSLWMLLALGLVRRNKKR